MKRDQMTAEEALLRQGPVHWSNDKLEEKSALGRAFRSPAGVDNLIPAEKRKPAKRNK